MRSMSVIMPYQLMLREFELIETHRWAMRLFAEGDSYETLQAQLQERSEMWQEDMDKSFRITMESINHKTLESRLR